MKRCPIIVSTNGACYGKPGPGGYAGILTFGSHKLTVSGHVDRTTNNRMELQAIIEAVKVLKKPCAITVKTDSQYICNGIAHAKERCANGWRTKTGARCANPDKWQELNDLKNAGGHTIYYCFANNDDDVKACRKIAVEKIEGATVNE